MSWLCLLCPAWFILGSFAADSINGTLHGRISRRIVKGPKVNIASFPHAVFLYFEKTRPSTCGSSLITVKTVVTSAHCLREFKTHDGSIHAYLGASVPQYAKAVRRIVKYKIHPKYNPVSGKFDLGLAKFDSEVPLMQGIRKIPISSQGFSANEAAFTVGWGKQWPNVLPDFSDMRQLTATKQRILSVSECVKTSGIKISPAHLCSVTVSGYHYRGDFGNGLVRIKENMALVGVVSYMVRDATLYANLVTARKWLRETVQELYHNEPMDPDCC